MAYHDYDHYDRPVYKKYVDVLELRKKDGTLAPMAIVWWNGSIFRIDKYKYEQFGESRTGSGGKHYLVWIKGQRRDMFLEKDKWFIETDRDPKANVRPPADPKLTAEEIRELLQDSYK